MRNYSKSTSFTTGKQLGPACQTMLSEHSCCPAPAPDALSLPSKNRQCISVSQCREVLSMASNQCV